MLCFEDRAAGIEVDQAFLKQRLRRPEWRDDLLGNWWCSSHAVVPYWLAFQQAAPASGCYPAFCAAMYIMVCGISGWICHMATLSLVEK